jgi:hypothetical protein
MKALEDLLNKVSFDVKTSLIQHFPKLAVQNPSITLEVDRDGNGTFTIYVDANQKKKKTPELGRYERFDRPL